MHDCFLSVTGLKLLLRMEHLPVVGEAYVPFLTTPCVPDVRVEFIRVNRLPDIPERYVAKGIHDRVYETADGNRIRFFYGDPGVAQPYGAAWETSEGSIRMAYLPEGARYLSDLGNSFAHLNVEQLLIRFDRLCLHAACVETPLGGILFSGPSGIGKSTQAGLWCRYRGARQINGDRPAVSFDGEKWLAWGMPYAGSSRVYVNDCCPIRAIVMLRQEKRCSVRRLGAGEAFRALWQGMAVHHWDRSFVEKASSLAMALIASVPVYEFGCTPDEAAVDFLEAWLRKEQNL